MICIYHNRDLDGWMSAAIVKLWHPNTELIGWDYGMPIPDLSFKEVIMVDISFPVDVMKANCNRLVWIDHHKSAILAWQDVELADLEDRFTIPGLRSSDFAACELTWKYFFPEKGIPEIVHLLGRYDCFGHKGTDEELKVLQFQYAARAYMSTPKDCLDYLKADIGEMEYSAEVRSLDELLIVGEGIYEYLCTEAQQIYERRFDVDFDGLKFGCVNQCRFNPINFGIQYHKDGYDGFACFHYQKGQWIYSLYNDNGQVDCSEICKKRGGGGHKGAAGFQTKTPIL